MSVRERLRKYPGPEEERLMLSRAAEILERGQQRSRLTATGFLTLHEQALIRQQLPELEPRFWGGAPETERAVCLYLPEYLTEESLLELDGPVAAIEARFSEREVLTHRDLLGALMGSGLERDAVGDLFVASGRALFFVTRAVVPFVLQSLESAGHAHLSLQELPPGQASLPEQKSSLRRDTVASLRLDAVLAAAFGLSREKAVQAIAAHRVQLDGAACEKPDAPVQEGCTLSLRGAGKARLEQAGARTKKGRIAIEIRRYL